MIDGGADVAPLAPKARRAETAASVGQSRGKPKTGTEETCRNGSRAEKQTSGQGRW
jgi:hypothetical protein